MSYNGSIKEIQMSQGKYSPVCPKGKVFIYNSYGQVPPLYTPGTGVEYDARLHFANYDDEGFDSYGYSCYNHEKEYVGVGLGIDRYGYTEFDYLVMDADEFDHICFYRTPL